MPAPTTQAKAEPAAKPAPAIEEVQAWRFEGKLYEDRADIDRVLATRALGAKVSELKLDPAAAQTVLESLVADQEKWVSLLNRLY